MHGPMNVKNIVPIIISFQKVTSSRNDTVCLRIVLAHCLKYLASTFTLRAVEAHPPCSLSNVN